MTRARWEDGSAVVNGWRIHVHPARTVEHAHEWEAVGRVTGVRHRCYSNATWPTAPSARRAAVAWARKQTFGGEGEG